MSYESILKARDKGAHATFGGSQWRWVVNDPTPESVVDYLSRPYATKVGTLLHSYAEKRITYRAKLTKTRADKSALYVFLRDGDVPDYAIDVDRYFENLVNYVNDAIGFRMTPEELCYFEDGMWGSADALSFSSNLLRIHDLKTGSTPAHMEQLKIYAAYYCLQHGIKPQTINYELRIYQGGDIIVDCPLGDEINDFVDTIVKVSAIKDGILKGA